MARYVQEHSTKWSNPAYSESGLVSRSKPETNRDMVGYLRGSPFTVLGLARIARGPVRDSWSCVSSRLTAFPAKATDRLRRLPKSPQERPPHPLPIREADFVRDHIQR